MEKSVEHYWKIRLAHVKENLEANNFQVFIVENTMDAKKTVLEEIFPATGARSVSWGGSMTFLATGLYKEFMSLQGIDVIDTLEKGLSQEDFLQRRRRSLLVDLFMTGSNAITEEGQLVNLDMMGNRIGGITFGPGAVIVFAGRNKIVPDLDAAITRIKAYAAPVNAMRLDKKTPCVKTSYCEECKSPERICNTWAITEKSFPKGRVRVVLINEDLGL